MSSSKLHLRLTCIALTISLSLAADWIAGPWFNIDSTVVRWSLFILNLALTTASLAYLIGQVWATQSVAMRELGVNDPSQLPSRERFAALAERRVTVGLLIQELVRQNRIRLDAARVEQRVQELAAPYEKPAEAAQFYRADRGMMNQIETGVLEDQVRDLRAVRVLVQEHALPGTWYGISGAGHRDRLLFGDLYGRGFDGRG